MGYVIKPVDETADLVIMVAHIAKPLVASDAAKKLRWLYDYAAYRISMRVTSFKNIRQRRGMVARLRSTRRFC